MQKLFYLIILIIFLFPVIALSQEDRFDPDLIPPEYFYRGLVLEVQNDRVTDPSGEEYLTQLVKVRILDGDEEGKELEVRNEGLFSINGGEGVAAGEKVIVYKTSAEGQDSYFIADTYRLPSLYWVLIIFFAVAILFSRWKGLTSIIGLGISILVIVKFVVPQIIQGKNPVIIALLGALIIALISIYLSHGFSRRTTIALVSTLITLGLAGLFAYMFVSFSKLFGLGSEEAFYLQFGPLEDLNLQGLLLGGIILGALGVLDDITTAQSATVDEIKKANPSLTTKELYVRGISVGREHIASLVNTLFLAYAGVSLPLFLFFTSQNIQPLWVTLNSEFVMEEVIRTLVGSIALILAVPITTFLAAYFFGKDQIVEGDKLLR